MTEHDIHIKDLRPIGKKKTRICLRCMCSGKNLIKYKNCDEYNNAREKEKEEIREIMGWD